jgi:glutamate-1-semialdehyde 2,1-aminomutase
MLKQGYLAGTSLYTCIDHSNEVIDNYINALESIFSIISECEKGKDIESMLDGPVCHDGFKRLN